MIIAKSLPNSIAYTNLTDANTRKAVMQLNENVTSLHTQLKEVQAVCKNGVGSGKSVNVEALAEEVAPLVATVVTQKTAEATAAATTATNASATAQSAASTATTKAGEAATSATNAATSETNASTSETNAGDSEDNAATSETNAATSASNAAASEANALTYKTAAESARDTAVAAAQECVWHTTLNYTNLALSLTKLSTGGTGHPYYGNGVFNLAAIVPDTSKSYVVSVRFVSTLTIQGSSTATTKYFRLLTNVSGDTEVKGSRTYSSTAYLYPGELLLGSSLTKTIAGTACFYIVNGTSAEDGVTGTAGFSTIIDISEAVS